MVLNQLFEETATSNVDSEKSKLNSLNLMDCSINMRTDDSRFGSEFNESMLRVDFSGPDGALPLGIMIAFSIHAPFSPFRAVQ